MIDYNLPASDADPHSVPARISEVSDDVWVRFALAPDAVAVGVQQVEVVLDRRHPQVACDLVLTDVEIAVAHSEEYAAALLAR